MDDAPNYGNTGSTIGHELTHGFDDEGRQYDAKGNLKDWWTTQDAAQFVKHADCVVDQYAKYVVVDDIHINSKLTEGEDVADLGGTILAYIAWKDADKGKDLTARDGLDVPTNASLSAWRSGLAKTLGPRTSACCAITDPHSPPKYRDQWSRGEHAGVRRGVRLQARLADGEAGGQSLQGVVIGSEATELE